MFQPAIAHSQRESFALTNMSISSCFQEKGERAGRSEQWRQRRDRNKNLLSSQPQGGPDTQATLRRLAIYRSKCQVFNLFNMVIDLLVVKLHFICSFLQFDQRIQAMIFPVANSEADFRETSHLTLTIPTLYYLRTQTMFFQFRMPKTLSRPLLKGFHD